MADEAARWKQYEYKSNSNLVLMSTDRSKNLSREPTGEVEAIQGAKAGKMGDRAQRVKPETSDIRLMSEKKKSRDEGEQYQSKKKTRSERSASVLDVMASSGYRPKTKETKSVYEKLLHFTTAYLGDQPQDIIMSAVDECLSILKDDALRDHDRKKQVESLLGKLPDERFAALIDLGKRVTDFTSEATGAEVVDNEIGVAVLIDEDEEQEQEGDTKFEIGDDSDDDGMDGEGGRALKVHGSLEDMGDDDVDPDLINPVEIDAYWLQREIAKSKNMDDHPQSMKLGDDVLEILKLSDAIEIENKLVGLLGFDQFDFVKRIMKNRVAMYFCTRLKRAQSDAERVAIENEMQAIPQARAILESLTFSHKTEGERKRDLDQKLRREMRGLKATVNVQDMSDLLPVSSDVSMAPKDQLDLEDLAFQQGGHFMSNRKCELPKGTQRIERKGFEEVHIPAPKPATDGADDLVLIKNLPEWAQPAFNNMKSLNRLQSKVHQCALYQPDNMLVCAPTGAGKTNVAMLTIMHEVGLHRNSDGSIDTSNFKVIYIAPMKALVAEITANFSKRLEPFGMKVHELTGDIQMTKQQISETTMIVTTPEKWDIVTRKAGDRAYTSLVRLIIIDEVHLLHDSRGPVIETIVARTLRQIESTQQMIRLVGLSATLPNYKDVATFMRVKADRGLFHFDASYRPVPLHQVYIGVMEKKPLKRFQVMNDITYEKVMERAGKNQVLIFVHSRKETTKTALSIKEMAEEKGELEKLMSSTSAAAEIIREAIENDMVKSADLKSVMKFGIGIHHAGMQRTDRELVEEMFADGNIQVLVSTATLAWGVNLPAHTVIIKGTQIYSPEKSSWIELSPLDVMQMMGRAGRPQFDTSGEGIIITQHTELQYYLSLLNQQLPIESQFVSKLADQLNAEVCLGTIRNVKEAVTWLGYTYLYVRMVRNPQLYGVSLESAEADKFMEQRRVDLVHAAASSLLRSSLVKYDKKTGSLQATDLGRVAAHYYVSHATISTFNEHLKEGMSDIEIFRLFSLAGEFAFIVVRQEEKVELEKLLERVPVPVKESMEESSAKVNVLLQAYISQLKLDGFALLADMVYVQQSAGRLMRAVFEIACKREWAGLASRTLQLCKMIDRRMWGSMSPLRQFKQIPEDIIRKFERNHDFSWERLFDLDPFQIGELMHFPQQGKAIHKYIHQVPKVEVSASVQPITRNCLKIDAVVTPDFSWDDNRHGSGEIFHVFVEDVDCEKILHHEVLVVKKKFIKEPHHLSFTVPIFDPFPPQYFLRIVSDRWIGSESVLPISFRNLLLPDKYPPHTELLDMQPLPTSALKNSEFSALYRGFRFFNPIQTQSFNSIFGSDENVLICAPTGSGKTVCAEFAIFRALSANPSARIVYIAPLADLVTERLADWTIRFGQGLGKVVVKLTGETAPDLKLLAKANIVLATPEVWDKMSRLWRKRPNVQNVDLFIFDELHLIGGERGPVLEVCVSRIRLMESSLEKRFRLIGLSASLANARDVGDWMGVKASSLFNFHPNVRPVPLEIHIQGFDITHYSSRMLAMARPAYISVSLYAGDKPASVFVGDRRQARTTALDLVTYAASENTPFRFRKCSAEELEPYLQKINDSILRETAASGVLLFHDALSSSDQKIVDILFSSGRCQLVVVSHSAIWGQRFPSYVVTIMGTQYYDGREHRYVDYPVTDILQIMGNASRPELDQSGKCFILCHGPKKEYYKKFLYEPIPVESHLDHALHDHLNAEVVAKSIESQSEAMDWITYSFFYLRLRQNPNYYNMQGRSNMHVSDHLSELIETVLGDLEESKCVAVEGDGVVSPLNLGMLSSYYYVLYTTIELFANSLKRKHRLRPIMELLSSASEFDDLAVRRKESGELQLLSNHMPHKLEKPAFNDPHVKTNLLLQAHLSRVSLKEDLAKDQMVIVQKALPLLYAMVDVIAANSWLKVALSCMELCQGIVQGAWATDSQLLQLPHISKQCAQRCKDASVNSIFDLLDLDDEPRNKLLGLNESQMADIAGPVASCCCMRSCVCCPDANQLTSLQPWPIATPRST